MTNREKIIKIIEKKGTYNGRSFSFDYYVIQPEDLADALLAANIGDVKEWKEKVECAKRILQIPALPNGTTDLSYFEYKGERIQDIARQRDEYKHRVEVAEHRVEIVERVFDNTMEVFHQMLSTMFPSIKIDLDEWKKDNLAIAEKELAEEKGE